MTMTIPQSTPVDELSWLSPSTSGMWMMVTANPGGGGGGDGDGAGDDEPLQNWSSLIGIITAIVGNVFIALALNVQRYAHTRLHKQRASIRRRARAAMKRTQRGAQSGSYGTVSRSGDGDNNREGNGATVLDDDGGEGDTQETDPLAASFHSSGSTDDDVDEEAERQTKVASTYLKSPYWWLGQILITLGEMGNFLAYGFAPASIVSPLGVVALISNCIIAPVMFHERFRQRDFWGVVVAIAGVVTVVLSANTQETKLNPDDVWGAITAMEFEMYLGFTVLLIILLMWASAKYGRRTILIDLGLVGLFGGYTALATKGVSSMLSSTLWRAFTTPVTYVLVFILLVTAIMQIRYVNKALQRFDSTQVIPIQFVMFTLCVILGSAVLYRDFENTTAKQAGKFVGGCLLTFFGVFLITSGREQNDDDEVLSEAEGVEETIGLARHEGSQQHIGDLHPRTASDPESRRSSRHSRLGFSEITRPQSPEGQGDSSPYHVVGQSTTPNTRGPESASLLGNPWDGAREATTPPGRGIRTRSADTFVRRSSVILAPSPSSPSTPIRDDYGLSSQTDGQPETPQARANTFGPGQHHRSGTFISPSPLASTVTTVMKDGFLRDKKSLSHKSSTRHIRSRIRASLFFNDNESDENAGNTGVPVSEDIHARDVNHEVPRYSGGGDDENLACTRTRSLSDTLGDFFKPK